MSVIMGSAATDCRVHWLCVRSAGGWVMVVTRDGQLSKALPKWVKV